MKWMQMYLVGYVVVLGGLIAALWKLGIIERVGGGSERSNRRPTRLSTRPRTR